MLNDFLTFGINNNYFEVKRIGNFSLAGIEGYSHINTSAIEFDKAKTNICNSLNLEQCKSCDALDILPAKNRLNFIEFKIFQDRRQLKEWIKNKSKFPKKIKDSYFILRALLQNRLFIHKGKADKFKRANKNFIISFDLKSNPLNTIAFSLTWFQVEALIQKELQTDYFIGENFNTPVCIQIRYFDSKYLSYQ